MKPPNERSRRPLPPTGIASPPSADRICVSHDKGHGRLEKRTLQSTLSMTLQGKWKGLKQGFKITRERTIRGQKTIETVYGVTSLSAKSATATQLLGYVREHWRIENSLYYVRDVTLGEDGCRVRSGTAPQVLAALRNAVVQLLSKVKSSSRQDAIEQLQVTPEKAYNIIGIPQTQ